jgi:hypothetical protein
LVSSLWVNAYKRHFFSHKKSKNAHNGLISAHKKYIYSWLQQSFLVWVLTKENIALLYLAISLRRLIDGVA